MCVAPPHSGPLPVREWVEQRSPWLTLESCPAAEAGGGVLWSLGEPMILTKVSCLLAPPRNRLPEVGPDLLPGQQVKKQSKSLVQPETLEPHTSFRLAPPPHPGLGLCVWFVEAGTWDPLQPSTLSGTRAKWQSRGNSLPRAHPHFYSPSCPSHWGPPLGSSSMRVHTRHTDTHRLNSPADNPSGVAPALQP